MAKELGVTLILIQRKIDSHKSFTSIHKGINRTWF